MKSKEEEMKSVFSNALNDIIEKTDKIALCFSCNIDDPLILVPVPNGYFIDWIPFNRHGDKITTDRASFQIEKGGLFTIHLIDKDGNILVSRDVEPVVESLTIHKFEMMDDD